MNETDLINHQQEIVSYIRRLPQLYDQIIDQVIMSLETEKQKVRERNERRLRAARQAETQARQGETDARQAMEAAKQAVEAAKQAVEAAEQERNAAKRRADAAAEAVRRFQATRRTLEENAKHVDVLETDVMSTMRGFGFSESELSVSAPDLPAKISIPEMQSRRDWIDNEVMNFSKHAHVYRGRNRICRWFRRDKMLSSYANLMAHILSLRDVCHKLLISSQQEQVSPDIDRKERRLLEGQGVAVALKLVNERMDTLRALKKKHVAATELRYRLQSNYATLEEEVQDNLDQMKGRCEYRLAEATHAWEKEISRLRLLAGQYTHDVDNSSPPWDSITWASWQSPSGIALANRVGTLRLRVHKSEEQLVIPAVLPFPSARSLLIETNGDGRAAAIQGVRALLVRLLATVPAGKLRFTFFDPVGSGQNVGAIMHLQDEDPDLVTSRAWTEQRQIEEQLARLREEMENVIQRYLRERYETIEEYNRQAGEVAEPYRVLVAFDFPENISPEAAKRLVSLVQNGPRAGIFTIVLRDTQKALPHGLALDDLTRHMDVIAWDGSRFIWKDGDLKDRVIEFDVPPDLVLRERKDESLFGRILMETGRSIADAKRVVVPFDKMYDLFAAQLANTSRPESRLPRPVFPADPSTWWGGDSTDGLIVPLGRAGARGVQCFDVGKVETLSHTLIAGQTGSGKSTLLHTLITGLALCYGPDEVQLYLVDFKQGVEFKKYADYRLPHARVVAIESEREYALSILQDLDRELAERGDLFKAFEAGNKYASYRRDSGRKLPRLLLIVDEFQEFFAQDDAVATQANQLLDRLVRQGRAFGIHVLLGSQTLAGAYTLARSTLGQMGVRIALPCNEEDSRLILSDKNGEARLLSRPGEAIYNDAMGLLEGNHRFQVAFLDDRAQERDRLLAGVWQVAESRRYMPERPLRVFQSHVPSHINDNGEITALLASPERDEVPPVPRVWIGEPISLGTPVAAAFRRRGGNNLLAVGQNEETALGMMTTAFLGLGAYLQRCGAQPEPSLSVLDFGTADADDDADYFAQLQDRLGFRGVRVGRRRQLPEIVAALCAETQRRLDEEDLRAPQRFLLIHGLHRARDLRQEEQSYGFSYGETPNAPSVAQQFGTILREGPEHGIHVVAWCDTVANLNRTLDRRAQREFAMRVAFQMGADDSSNFIDTPTASKLGPNRALFVHEDEGRSAKVRPYDRPSAPWLEWAADRVRELA